MMSDNTSVEARTSRDKRTLELEELRKKQLAKSRQESMVDNGIQPMPMESWLQQQKVQTQESRQKQIDATENLRKYRGVVESGNDLKDELKRKEQEAATLRHSYRGKPDAILSHQVKKISKGISSMDLTGNSASTCTSFIPAETSSKCDREFSNSKLNIGDGESSDASKEIENSNDRKVSDATVSDWELLSEKGRMSTAGSVSEISSAYMVTLNSSDSSTSEKVNMDTLYVVPSGDGVDSEIDTESLGKDTGSSYHTNEPDAAAGPNISAIKGDENALSAKKEALKEWTITNVSVSFGLLVLKDDAPKLGSYNAPVECKLLENILTKMRVLAKQSLDQEIKSSNIMLADSETNPVHIHVDNDGAYKVPASRPNTQRCLIRLSIPIKYVSSDHDAKTTAQSLVCGALRRALKSRAIV